MEDRTGPFFIISSVFNRNFHFLIGEKCWISVSVSSYSLDRLYHSGIHRLYLLLDSHQWRLFLASQGYLVLSPNYRGGRFKSLIFFVLQ